MKKIMITTLSLGLLLGLSTVVFANTGTKTEASAEELAHFKLTNPNITSSEVDSIMKQREELDELYKQIDALELNYGVRVDNTKDPHKEPIHRDDLPKGQREKCMQLSIKIWDKEIQLLDVQYKAGLIKEDVYTVDKNNFKYFKDKELQELNQ
ncbi:hypothetical protein COE20_16915 [Bacillus cereus]|uniref:hypothetical protein n=1 Tax=Bacillus cereus TaxID=1396 RepID=UPI000BEB33D8|nr:hypothetical protein [Bacillus cereus]PDZ07884.1 hypothetical protein CON03_00265 [Bacillus cereus]PFE47559.1 hypothetical protein CN317_12065 [Bacillus cereus]PFN13799.1 hypothetical protein COJ72_20985 [Bacillus cereus]PFS58480.1 hypothetical protein COK41_23065 [Bacillus cereus]PGY26794.1 hypothetical protein COE20_16915 [Bacillus cereus]